MTKQTKKDSGKTIRPLPPYWAKESPSIRCLFLCLILLLAGCSMGEPVDTAASETPPALQTLTGTLIDATTNVLALETDDGTVYRFARQDDITVAPDAGMEIGCIVRISYYGALTKTDGLQDAEVIRISIASPETVSTPEASFTASLVSATSAVPNGAGRHAKHSGCGLFPCGARSANSKRNELGGKGGDRFLSSAVPKRRRPSR